MNKHKKFRTFIISLIITIILLLVPLAIGFTYQKPWYLSIENTLYINVTYKGWSQDNFLNLYNNQVSLKSLYNSQVNGINVLFSGLYPITVSMFTFSLLSTIILGVQMNSKSLFPNKDLENDIHKYGNSFIVFFSILIFILAILTTIGALLVVGNWNANLYESKTNGAKYSATANTYISIVFLIMSSISMIIASIINIHCEKKSSLYK